MARIPCCCVCGQAGSCSSNWTPSLGASVRHEFGLKKKKKTGRGEIKFVLWGVPIVAQWLTNLTRNHEAAGSIPGLAQWVKDLALP